MRDGSNLQSQLPASWCWTDTATLFSFVTSGSRGWATYYSSEGSLFLRIGNLDHASVSLDLTNLQRVDPPKGAEANRTIVKAGDILISVTADVGMIAVVPQSIEKAFM